MSTALYIEKIDGSLSDAICSVSFPNVSLCHHRTQYRENTASVQQSLLLSIQIFLTWQKQRKDTTEEYRPVLHENKGKYVWPCNYLSGKGGDSYVYIKSCFIAVLLIG